MHLETLPNVQWSVINWITIRKHQTILWIKNYQWHLITSSNVRISYSFHHQNVALRQHIFLWMLSTMDIYNTNFPHISENLSNLQYKSYQKSWNMPLKRLYFSLIWIQEVFYNSCFHMFQIWILFPTCFDKKLIAKNGDLKC